MIFEDISYKNAFYRVIYLHQLELNSFSTALECCKIFEYFGLPSAVKQCQEYLKQPVKVENAITVYEINVDVGGDPVAVQECLKLFASNTREVLKTVAFSRAQLCTILTIFDMPKLNIESEIDLADALHNFAEMHNALPVAGNEGRFTELVKPALEKIRLLTLTAKALVSSNSIRALYTNEQVLGVLANLIVPDGNMFELPEGISPCKENRFDKLDDASFAQYSELVESTKNESSVEILANTAQIETPKTNNQESSIDWTPAKVQNGRKQIDLTETPGASDVGTPIGNSTADSTTLVEGLHTNPAGEM